MSRRDFGLSLLATVVVGLLFSVYLLFVGVPRTHARNLYNEAEALFTQGDDNESRQKLEAAYAVWPEQYILDTLQNGFSN